MLQPLCMPALIYLIFSVTHVIIDMYKENYDKAVLEFFISAIFTLLLNLLCRQGLGIVSWLIVSIPFLLITWDRRRMGQCQYIALMAHGLRIKVVLILMKILCFQKFLRIFQKFKIF
jgi:hypothetical protein